jgi:hypothetical protein
MVPIGPAFLVDARESSDREFDAAFNAVLQQQAVGLVITLRMA